MIIFYLCFFIAAAFTESNAQGNADKDKNTAEIIYTEGDNFEVLDSSGNSTGIDPYDAIGRRLREGDIILTYENTYVEIQLLNSEHIIKIAENTDFRLERINVKKESSFKMLYGSIRAKVAMLGSEEKFRIRGNDATAGVRGTDFGMTVVVPKEGESTVPYTRVYCFKGIVEVEPVLKVGEKTGEPEIKPAVIKADEMVTISGENYKTPYTIQTIPKDIIDYWREHNFKGAPVPLKNKKTVSISNKKTALPGSGKRGVNKEEKQKINNRRNIGKELSRELVKLRNSRDNYLGAGVIFLSAGVIFETAAVLGIVFPSYIGQAFPSIDVTLAANVFAVSGGVFIAVSFFSLIKTKQIEKRIIRLQNRR
ncbi:MAG: FecR domain-containing protein [Spirochaetes bacterium]|nr:FecR domain-containing protein [Spirochaetota bacterium]